jgi:hypothetical protein
MFPALDIRQPESPIQQYGQAQQIVSQQQNQQLQALQIQEQTRLLRDQDATTRAMSSLKPDASGRIDYDTLPNLVLQNGGSANAAMSATKSIFALKQTASDIAKNDAATNLSNADTVAKNNDAYRGRILNVVQQADPAAKQAQWDSEITREEQAGTIQPGQISHTYPGDQQATAIANHFALGSQLVKEAQERQQLADQAWKTVNGQLVNTVTHETIGGKLDTDSLNSGLQTRWQVLNPGQPLPDWAKLNPNSTPLDFDRVDKLLEATEKGKATAAQQATVNAIRSQTFQLATEKEGYNWVTGTATKGPAAGKVVAVPQSQIGQYGIQDAGKMESADITKTQSGRQWLTLANKQGDPNGPPDQMGISQLLDVMDKKKELGPLAGRLNEFLAGTWGSGNADYAAFRTKLDLSNTLLATVHSGRLGPFLMENMQGLASAKKMDATTLRSAFNSEKDYVQDRALDPAPPNYNATAATSGNATKTGATALPQGGGKVIDKNTAMQFYQAAGNDPDKARTLALKNGWQIPKAQ